MMSYSISSVGVMVVVLMMVGNVLIRYIGVENRFFWFVYLYLLM